MTKLFYFNGLTSARGQSIFEFFVLLTAITGLCLFGGSFLVKVRAELVKHHQTAVAKITEPPAPVVEE